MCLSWETNEQEFESESEFDWINREKRHKFFNTRSPLHATYSMRLNLDIDSFSLLISSHVFDEFWDIAVVLARSLSYYRSFLASLISIRIYILNSNSKLKLKLKLNFKFEFQVSKFESVNENREKRIFPLLLLAPNSLSFARFLVPLDHYET